MYSTDGRPDAPPQYSTDVPSYPNMQQQPMQQAPMQPMQPMQPMPQQVQMVQQPMAQQVVYVQQPIPMQQQNLGQMYGTTTTVQEGTVTTSQVQQQPAPVQPAPVHTTVVVNSNGIALPPPKNAQEYYYQQSQLACNTGMGCCSCHACAYFILFCWVIGGLYSIYYAFDVLDNIHDDYDTYNGTWTCDYYATDEYCMVEADDTVYCIFTDCNTAETVYTISIFEGFIVLIGGIVGLIAICQFMPKLMRVPMGVALVSILFDIIFAIIMESNWSSVIFNGAISCLVFYLFYRNFKMMREAEVTFPA